MSPQPNLLPSNELASNVSRSTLENLKMIGRAFVQTFGAHACEVIIHDLRDLEHSIIWIAGNVTGRQVGGPMTDQGIELIRHGQYQSLLNYQTYTEDGRTLKSSSVFLYDENGQPWGAFCINLDVTPYLRFMQQLNAGLLHSEAPEVGETFARDVEETVRNMLAEVVFEYGKPLDGLSKLDRLALIQILERKGLFQIKRAVPLIAKKLGVSRYTIYNYLNELREKPNPVGAEVG